MFDLRALVADMPEITILTVNLLLADRNRNIVLLGIVDGALAVAQFKLRVLPRVR